MYPKIVEWTFKTIFGFRQVDITILVSGNGKAQYMLEFWLKRWVDFSSRQHVLSFCSNILCSCLSLVHTVKMLNFKKYIYFVYVCVLFCICI